jgi:hypothetical protein
MNGYSLRLRFQDFTEIRRRTQALGRAVVLSAVLYRENQNSGLIQRQPVSH